MSVLYIHNIAGITVVNPLSITVFYDSGLEELYASHCRLVELKRTVAQYPALQILDVSFNQIDNVETLVI